MNALNDIICIINNIDRSLVYPAEFFRSNAKIKDGLVNWLKENQVR